MRSTEPQAFSLDVLFAGDMAGRVDKCLRIAGEASAAEKAGFRVGLLHVPASSEETQPVSPELRACLRHSSIAIVEDARDAAARLFVVYPPCGASAPQWIEVARKAERVVMVPDLYSMPGEETFCLPPALLRKVSVAPTTDALRETLRDVKLRIERGNWLPVINHCETRRVLRGLPAVGAILPPDWPGAVDALGDILRDAGHVNVHLWRDRGPRRHLHKIPGGWKAFDGAEISLAWFLRRIDMLILLDQPGRSDVPEAVIAAAQAAGTHVAAPPSLSSRVPGSVLMLEPGDLAAQINQARAQKMASQPLKEYAAERFVKRLPSLIKTKPAKLRKARSTADKTKPRVLFVPKGGVGLGHVMRLLAVARRSGGAFDPVFVSLSESAGLIERLGFRTEYIPSAAYADVPGAEWDPWFQYELAQLIDAYDASAVVFDGSDPPAVLSRAVASRSWCRAVWIRRGMWAPGYDPSLQRSGNYDLIIEPGDLAASRDRGATASKREETVGVDPITLLDAGELLPRAEAARSIGFDPSRPAVLLQIGSGENRDILGLIDQAVRACRRYPDLQIAVAEWANASGALDLWSGITVLKGVPLSQYFHAFDFTISAAGYNSFHEIIHFGLPSILVPNQAPRMDDQAGRSAYAQDEGAAIELKEHEFAELPAILDLFMRAEFRAVMQENCRKLARSNGARAASRMIAELVS